MKPLISINGWLVRDTGGGVKFMTGDKPYRNYNTDTNEKTHIERKTGYWRNDRWTCLFFSELGIGQEEINEILPGLDWNSEPQPFTLQLWKKED